MIEHKRIEVLGTDGFTQILHHLTPMTEKAARFLNTFPLHTVCMTERDYASAKLEMPAHGCWIVEAH